MEAENDVTQITVALWPVVRTGSFAHPLIAVPLVPNVIAPEGAAELALEVTVAINVTLSFVTGALGDTNSAVTVPIGDATAVVLGPVTTAVGPELAGVPEPAALLAVSCTTIA